MARTVADRMVETIAAAGVKRIYGIVGDSLNGFTDSVRRHGGIDWLHVRHEEVAAFAAAGEAHVTGLLMLGTDFPYRQFFPARVSPRWTSDQRQSAGARTLNWVCSAIS
jgi:Thiamine pyrophosphate enzyme, N-terminal TPP binding domain